MNSRRIRGVCLAAVLLLDASWHHSAVHGQNPRPRQRDNRPVDTQAIDAMAKKAREVFILTTADLAREYERAGELEKSHKLLKEIRSLQDDIPGLRDQIKRLDEAILSSNALEFDIQASSEWGTPRGRVFSGRKLRISASGTYRVSVTTSVDVNGVTSRDPKSDMVREIPLGALMGMIVTEGVTSQPFRVGSGLEYEPKMDGQLFLRVNAPRDARCNGRIEVKMSGFIRAVGDD